MTSFLASHHQNVISPTVDPTLPIDPDLVLDFDTRGPRAADELQTLLNEVWVQNPVVLYAKVRQSLSSQQCSSLNPGQYYSAASREIKAMLLDMNLRPSPTFFHVDRRGMSLFPLRGSLVP